MTELGTTQRKSPGPGVYLGFHCQNSELSPLPRPTRLLWASLLLCARPRVASEGPGWEIGTWFILRNTWNGCIKHACWYLSATPDHVHLTVPFHGCDNDGFDPGARRDA